LVPKQDLILEYQEEGEWKEKRFALVGAIDVFTRRRKFQIYPTANSEAVLLLLRRCVIDWGKPTTVRTDNGKNYISERTELFLKALDIAIDRCDPYSPQQKPHIERLFRTLQHGEFEMLPGYCGHSVAERQAIRESDNALRLRMEPVAFQEWLDRWCEKSHLEGSKGLDGRSPIEVLATAIRSGWKAQELADERALDFLILPVKSRKVQKGGIQVNNRWYIAGELGRMVGAEVHVRWHPDDPNRIYVYDSEELGRMICVAVAENPLSGEQQARVAAAAKVEYRLAKEEVSAKRKQAKRLKRMVESDPAQLVKVSKAGNVDLNSPRVPVTKAIDPFFPPAPFEELGREPVSGKNRESGKVLPSSETKTPQQLFQEHSSRYRSLLELQILEGGELDEEEKEFSSFWEEISPAAAKATKEAVNRKKAYALTGFYD
jgi:transposase InsO family protein